VERQALRQIPVSDAVTKEVVTVNEGLSVNEAFRHMEELQEHHHAYPVVDGAGRLVGLFTLNDLKRTLADDRGGARLSEVISKNLELAHPDQTLDVVMIKLGRNGVSQLPVVSRKDASKLLGIITLHDIAEALSKEDDAGAAANDEGA
jgi:chloride channel protein, CIC family